LESMAKKLRENGSVNINLGDQSETVTPANNVKLEVELEESNGKYELEFVLEWNENDKETDSISISENRNKKRRDNSLVFFMVQDGIEPPTQGFSVLCSTG